LTRVLLTVLLDYEVVGQMNFKCVSSGLFDCVVTTTWRWC